MKTKTDLKIRVNVGHSLVTKQVNVNDTLFADSMVSGGLNVSLCTVFLFELFEWNHLVVWFKLSLLIFISFEELTGCYQSSTSAK